MEKTARELELTGGNESPDAMEIIQKYFSDFTNVQLEQFARLEPLYREWNAQINVISRKDIEGLYEKHVLHSLSIAAAFNFPDDSAVIDIGTGGGFPGLPLAIYFPNTNFHLVDSVAKKLKVVDAIATAIGLKNITTEQTRVESIRNRKFDFVVSRAVAPLGELWTWSKPLLKVSHAGTGNEAPHPGLICLKGGDLASEISDSGTRPRVVEIYEIFPENFFKEKYLLYVTR